MATARVSGATCTAGQWAEGRGGVEGCSYSEHVMDTTHSIVRVYVHVVRWGRVLEVYIHPLLCVSHPFLDTMNSFDTCNHQSHSLLYFWG